MTKTIRISDNAYNVLSALKRVDDEVPDTFEALIDRMLNEYFKQENWSYEE